MPDIHYWLAKLLHAQLRRLAFILGWKDPPPMRELHPHDPRWRDFSEGLASLVDQALTVLEKRRIYASAIYYETLLGRVGRN